MSKRISEADFDPRKHVKEYKRKFNECGKVWHSLEKREKEIEKSILGNSFTQCAFCGNQYVHLQANRNIESAQSELDRLRSCSNCGSKNYEKDIIIYEKKIIFW